MATSQRRSALALNGLFAVKRLVRAVITLWLVSLLTFVMLQLAPGSFADISAI